jgi:hypothetical protein
MFCARCGQQIPDASETCPLCGREATIEVPPQPYAAEGIVAVVAAPNSRAVPAAKPLRKDLQGVGGWLLFFCIATTIVSPVAALNAVLASEAAAQLNRGTLVTAAFAIFGLVVGFSVWTKSSLAISMLRVYFLVLGGLALLNVSFLLAVRLHAADEFTVLAHVRTLIFVAIWAAYFHTSERVRGTLGRNL